VRKEKGRVGNGRLIFIDGISMRSNEPFDQMIVQYASMATAERGISFALDVLNSLRSFALPKKTDGRLMTYIGDNSMALVLDFRRQIIHPIRADDEQKVGGVVAIELDWPMRVPFAQNKHAKIALDILSNPGDAF
jgi:hypothetical protein